MNQLFKKPHLIFLVSIPIIVLIGFMNRNTVLVINIHATYYVFKYNDLTTLISIYFGFIGIGYWIMLKMKKKLSKRFNFIHITITYLGLILIWGLTKFFRNSIMEYDFNDNLTLVIYLISMIIIIGQVIYPINIIKGIKNHLLTKLKASF